MEYTQAYVRHFIPSNKSKLLLQYEAGMLIYRRLVGNYQKSIGRSEAFVNFLMVWSCTRRWNTIRLPNMRMQTLKSIFLSNGEIFHLNIPSL